MEFYSHFYQNLIGETYTQTVAEHCRNSAQYAQYALVRIGLGQSGYLAGLLHDMGKMKAEFQEYLMNGKGNRGSVNHTFAGCRLLMTQFHGEQAATCEDLTAELLAFAVGSHHGLFDCVDQEGHCGFLHRLQKENIGYDECLENYLTQCAGIEEITQLFHAANTEMSPIYEKLGQLAGKSDEEFSFYQGLLARLLLSAVIEGDRRDTAEFMTGIHQPQDPKNYSEFWGTYLSYLEGKLNQFPKNAPIQQARATISQKCYDFGEQQGGIIRLNVPTGGGKTLSSLRFALKQACKWGKRRLIFTSPLLAILEQNAAVIREYLGDDSIVLEHHSNVVTEASSGELDSRELAVENWNHPVIITTLVQLLNTLFAGKTTAIRRFQSLCNSVIVIDEVQTVPNRMLSLFHLAVNFLAEVCDATVVLCSATQPCLEKVAHSIHPEPSQMVPYDAELWSVFRRTEIRDGGGMTLKELAYFAKETMKQVKSLLIVCNKKEQAVNLLATLDGVAEVCCHLSAAMCPEHRRNTLEQLYQGLAAGKSCLCVATQVIEAGVDISFQCVIRITAGMDNVVQAAGRCNRNANATISPVYLITLQNENLGRLEDIRRAKEATISLLSAYKAAPARFDFDLASDAAIVYYYNCLHGEMPRGAQDYWLPREKVSIFSLLSDNRKYWDDSSIFYGRFMLNQAFRMAGDVFSVFDSDTHDVVVPYGNGRELIAELIAQSSPDVSFLKQWVSRVKSYTVSLFNYQLQALKDVIAEYSGVLVLPPEYYDEKIGFTLNAGELDFLEV